MVVCMTLCIVMSLGFIGISFRVLFIICYDGGCKVAFVGRNENWEGVKCARFLFVFQFVVNAVKQRNSEDQSCGDRSLWRDYFADKLAFYPFFCSLIYYSHFFLSVSSNSCTVMWIFPIKHVCALSVLFLRYCLCSAKYVGARSGLAVLIRSNRLHISQSFSLSYKKLRVFQQNFTKKNGKYNLCE